MQRKLGVVLAAALVLGTLWGTGTAFASHTFPDVPSGAFYHGAVSWAYDNGITTGVGSTGEFQPDAPTTRGQMVVFLQRLHDLMERNDPWAVVKSDGTAARGEHVTSSRKLGVGQYEVIFDHDVTDCAYVVSLGNPATSVAVGMASAVRRSTTTRGVFVATFDKDGANANLAFHLSVNC